MARPALLLAACAALPACGNPIYECPTLDELGLDTSVTATPGPDVDFPPFTLGVEYIQTGLASLYAGTGLRAAKTRLEVFEWGTSEPRAPSGTAHAYDWRCTDAQVGEWQQAGIVDIQSYLSPLNRWGSTSVRTDLRPSDRHLDSYRAWVNALIERYDGDGDDDMPGLVRPVRHWVVGGEWTGFWPGDDASAYLELLEITREEARAASSDVLIGTIPFMMVDVFEGNEPTDAEIEARLVDPPPGYRNSTSGMLEILDRDDLYDYVDVHALGDYTELPPLMAWMRAELDARGVDKPVFIDDAFPMSFLANAAGWGPWYPADEQDTYDAAYAVLEDIARLRDDGSGEAWVRAAAARGTVQKAVTALGEGYAGIQVGNTEDWMSDDGPALRRTTVRFIGGAAMFGAADVTHPDGYDLQHVRVPGARRAAWYALALLSDALLGLGATGDEAADAALPYTATRLGGATGVRGYKLERNGEELWVVWVEDGVLQLPGEALATETASLDVGEGVSAVRLTTTPTTAADPDTEDLAVTEGVATFTLSEDPVFVAPVR